MNRKIFLWTVLFFSLPFIGFSQTKELTKEAYIGRVKANPDSISSLVDLRRAGGYTPEYAELQPLFNTLSKSVRTSKEGKEFQAYLAALKKVSVGQKAPEFVQNDTSGNPIHLQDFKGKYVLLEFWASWCPDCREANPGLVATYAKFKSEKFEILGISFDTNKASWLKGIHDDKLSWKHVSDLKKWQNDVGTLYAVRSIPQNVLIDPKGIIIARNLKNDEFKKNWQKYFANQRSTYPNNA